MRRTAAIFVLTIVLAAFFPISAFGDYSIPSLKITAQMQTDNSLRVLSVRAYDFDESYSIIKIPLTRTSDDSSIDISSVRFADTAISSMASDTEGDQESDAEASQDAGSWRILEPIRFQTAWRDLYNSTEGLKSDVDTTFEDLQKRIADGDSSSDFFTLPAVNSYAFDQRYNDVYIFLVGASKSVSVEMDYVIEDACTVYDDVSEMYWTYVSPWQDTDTDQASLQIRLPVPDGETVIPGENVFAWGHGPAGSLEIDQDGSVDYNIGSLKSGDYADVHLIFPADWLANISKKDIVNGIREESAIAEEAAWTDRTTADAVNNLILDIVQLSACLILLGLCLIAYLLRRRADRIVTADGEANAAFERMRRFEPAVLGRLMRKNQWNSMDFITTLESLAERGVIKIETGSAQMNSTSVRFRLALKAKREELSLLDQATLRFIFDTVGSDYHLVGLNDIIDKCSKEPVVVRASMQSWQKQLDSDVRKADIFDEKSRKWMFRMGIGAGIVTALGVLEWVFSGQAFPAVAVIATGIVMAFIAYSMPRYTQSGYALLNAISITVCNNHNGNDCKTSLAEDACGKDEWQRLLSETLERETF